MAGKEGEKIMVYSWKTFTYPISASEAGKEIEAIEKQYGKVTSDLLLERAKDEENPLHSCFEWDDAVAGHKYRLHQATVLILNLTVEEEKVETPKPVKAYYNVSEGTKKGTFINAKTAFANPDTRDIVLRRAFREFQSFKEKYQELKEFAEIFKTFDNMIADMEVEAETGAQSPSSTM